MPTQRKIWPLLLLILGAALTLRAWYGSDYLHQNRFWDEQYALKNVRTFLVTGKVEPVNAYYPSPVWSVPLASVLKISDTLYARSGNVIYRVLDDDYGFTPTGILLCRLMQGIYGTLAVLFVYLAGCRLFTPRVALLAAAMVAFAPWAIHASGYIKPDALLLMSITLSFWASVAAVDEPTVKRHLLAGLAIALALSSKLTGGLIAIPLVVAALILGRQERRRVMLLVVAGASSAAIFVALNPYWVLYLSFLDGLKRDYAMRAGWAEMTRLAMPGRVVGFVTDSYLHGLLLGGASLIGFVLLTAGLFRSRQTFALEPDGELPMGRAKEAMFVVFPVLYTLVYIIQTPYFKANNFLPLVLFTALSAAWLIDKGWREAVRRWPTSQHPAVVGLLSFVFAAVVVLPGWTYVYRSLTPTTRDLARLFLDNSLGKPASARLVHTEAWQEPRTPWGSGERVLHAGLSAIHEVPNLGELPTQTLDLSDGMVFFEQRQESGSELLHQRAVGGPVAEIKAFRAAPFKARGPAMVAVAYGWRRSQKYLDLESRPCAGSAGGCRAIDLPSDLAPEELASFFLLLTWENLAGSGVTPSINVAGRTLELAVASKQPRGMLYVSPRFQLGDGPSVARLVRDDVFGDGEMLIQLARWVPGRVPR